MIQIENVSVYGWEAAIRGMRNPMNSWDKSDSGICGSISCEECNLNPGEYEPCYHNLFDIVIGKNDLKLMKSLSKAGNDHAKFLRFINVTMDVSAPLYWWKEADTYRVGKEQNSCSTMHKIHAKEFTLDDFSGEHLIDNVFTCGCPIKIYDKEDDLERVIISPIRILEMTIEVLNSCRKLFLETKDKKYWWQMVQLLPSSYNQKRTVQLNYQVLKSMYFARKDHKLDEWREFCAWCETLPYFREICIGE